MGAAAPACLSAHQHPAVRLLPAAHVKVGRRNVYRWIHDSMHINNLLYNYMHGENRRSRRAWLSLLELCRVASEVCEAEFVSRTRVY